MSNPKKRRIPAHTPGAGGDRMGFALGRLKDAMAHVKKMDHRLGMQTYYIEQCMGGKNDDAAVMGYARDMEEDLDEIWDALAGAYLNVKTHRDFSAPREAIHRSGLRTVYPGEVWTYSLTDACPLCGSLLLHGPRSSDWRCPYCDKRIYGPVPAPPNHPR